MAVENQRPVSIEIANADGYTRPPLHDFFMTRYTEAYAAEIAAFVAVVGAAKPPRRTAATDCLRWRSPMRRCGRSNREGRTVKVDEFPLVEV